MASVNQIRRLLDLLDHLQSDEAHNARQLADRLGVSRRTLFRDLRALEKLGFNVRYDDRATRYVVTADDGQGGSSEISTDELKALLTLGQRLDDPNAQPDDSPVTDVSALLAAAGGGNGRAGIKNLPELIDLRPDGAVSEEDAPLYGRLLEALCEHRRVRVLIADGDDGPKDVTVLSPYRLIFSHCRWHVAGHDAKQERVRVIALEHLTAVDSTEERFRLPDPEQVTAAVESAWRTDVEAGQAYDVVVRFSRDIASDVASRRWFRSQELSWLDSGELELRTRSIGLDQMASWVLSFGADAEALSPEPLKERMEDHFKRLCARYEECSVVA